jgi:predicted nucleotidyltransferase
MPEQLALDVYSSDQVELLRHEVGKEWPFIIAARARSRDLLDDMGRKLFPLLQDDATCVVFGSLARLEFTESSDIDWTLLVDGCAQAEHRDVADRIKGRLREMKLRQPSAGGPFGHLTFSHDLIHRIGGDDDTNRNTTQRLLLLLESTPLGRSAAYDRVVRRVLERYIEEDLVGLRDTPFRVPRFLQNDVVRYWRTMAVDFAHKRRARGSSGWALRTAKLRMSRKLMYASGLLSCFSCEFLLGAQHMQSRYVDSNRVVDHLSHLVRTTPLDIMARVLLFYFGKVSGPAVELFTAYDEFLGLLGDAERRAQLDGLKPADADTDPVYRSVRELGTRFQEALTEIFFTCDTPVRDLTRRYGVF